MVLSSSLHLTGRTKKGDIIESMLGVETLARMLLFRLHQESRSALDS